MTKKIENLVLSVATGYNWNILKPFIKSLRKFYNDKVILIINNDKKLISKLIEYNIDYHVIVTSEIKKNFLKPNKIHPNHYRYAAYIKVLEKLNYFPHKILLTDSRDVVFQSNLFSNDWSSPINFFLEEGKILNDNRNSRWLLRTVGKNNYDRIKNKFISCSGTTLGNFNEILEYSRLMTKYLNKFPYKKPLRHIISFKKIEPGYDQGIHNFIVYGDLFSNQKLHENNVSDICTTASMKKFEFNKSGELLNSMKKVYSLIHQYDRAFDNAGNNIFKFDKLYE